MSLLNLNLALLAYEDGPASIQPKLRLADLQWSLLGIPTNNFRQIPLSLAAGELLTVASTARTITYSAATNFQITKTSEDRMRITASIGQRVGRSYGDSTTAWALARTGNVMRLTTTGGTAPNFSSFQPGDYVYLSSPVSAFNLGEFQIIKRGSNYVEWVSDFGNSDAFVGGVNIYSSGPIQRGDILDISSSDFATPNQGQYPVVLATDTFIEVLNQGAFVETVTGVTSGITIYPFSYKWMVLAVDHKVVVGLNGEAPSDKIVVEPPVEGDLTKSPGLMLKRGKVFEVQIFNPSLTPVSGFLILAE